MIETIADVQRLAVEGFTDWAELGDVRVVSKDDLLLFSYTDKAQYAGRWNPFERMSRGLIINRVTGEIVARPFDKFFNWGERGQVTDMPIVSVTEKVDGSLVISRRDESGNIVFSTRGSFDSEQARWATKWLHQSYASSHFQYWPDDCTFMFRRSILAIASWLTIRVGAALYCLLFAIDILVSTGRKSSSVSLH